MRISKREKYRDGRIVVLLMIATSLIVVDLFFSKLPPYSQKTIAGNRDMLCFSEGVTSNTSSCFKVSGTERKIPNRLRSIFFLPVQINTANRDLLTTIKGIGPSLADKIITYRMEFGPFKTKYDLMELKGVGVKRAEHLLPFLVFDEVAWEAN